MFLRNNEEKQYRKLTKSEVGSSKRLTKLRKLSKAHQEKKKTQQPISGMKSEISLQIVQILKRIVKEYYQQLYGNNFNNLNGQIY